MNLHFIQTVIVIPVTLDSFYLEANYNDQMISREEVNVILDHLESALVYMLGHPNKLICDVELVKDHERQLLLPKLPSQQPPPLEGSALYPPIESRSPLGDVKNMFELIELQVEKTPQRIAVRSGLL